MKNSNAQQQEKYSYHTSKHKDINEEDEEEEADTSDWEEWDEGELFIFEDKNNEEKKKEANSSYFTHEESYIFKNLIKKHKTRKKQSETKS